MSEILHGGSQADDVTVKVKQSISFIFIHDYVMQKVLEDLNVPKKFLTQQKNLLYQKNDAIQ